MLVYLDYFHITITLLGLMFINNSQQESIIELCIEVDRIPAP
jgi:hypothetical protein